MATIKITLDKRESNRHSDGRHPVVLRIGHKSKTRDIGLDVYVFEDQITFDPLKISGTLNAVRHTKRIDKLHKEVDLWLDENKAIIKLWRIVHLKDEIEKRFFNKQPDLSLLSHSAKMLYRYHVEKRFSTASSYEDALKLVVKYQMKQARQDDKVIIKSLFNKNESDCFTVKKQYLKYDMPIKSITVSFAQELKTYVDSRTSSKNSVGIFLRSLQAVLNDAERTHTDLKGHKPLEGIKKSSSHNAQVVLTYDEIDLYRQTDYPTDSPQFHVRNYFLFMFNNMGMNFYDMALLKVHQFDGERINYVRKKNENSDGDFFSIKQTDEARHIIAHYSHGLSPDDYIFPILSADIPESRIFRVKNDKVKWFNKHMKKMTADLGIEKNVTTYTARDTWTNLGLDMGIDIRKISSGLGHASVKTTEKHYMQTMQERILDEINSQITTKPA
jgi:integrase